MKLDNIRFGHATNSSSSHSVLVLSKTNQYVPSSDGSYPDGEFGWSYFVLQTPEDKLKYFYAMLLSSVLYNQDDYIKKVIGKDLFGLDFSNDMLGYYVDHQSVLNFPLKYGKDNTIDWDFINDVREFFLKENVVILGGNDNSYSPEDYDFENNYDFSNLLGYGDVVSRKDGNNYWTLFNRYSGTKIRLDFENDRFEHIKKLDSPELVDLKITDYCPFDCPFCYQGSTAKGVHASLNYSDIMRLVSAFNTMGVLEVAIGGGEPTFHPEFPELVRQLNDAGINANFTTRSLHWLDNKTILNNIRKFAYSTEKVEDIQKVLDALRERNISRIILNIHIVMGTVTQQEFKDLLTFTHNEGLSVTLLGYKSVERGAEFEPIDYYWWYDVVKEVYGSYHRYIAVDTVMIQQYKDLISSVAAETTYHLTEGSHSLYVDLVGKYIAPSSYSKSKHPYDTVDKIPSLFRKIEVE